MFTPVFPTFLLGDFFGEFVRLTAVVPVLLPRPSLHVFRFVFVKEARGEGGSYAAYIPWMSHLICA